MSVVWDGESITIWTVYNVETNIENVEVLYSLNGFTWRELSTKWSLLNTVTVNNLILDGTSTIINNTTLNWDLVITWSGKLQKTWSTSIYYSLVVNGATENNGVIWWNSNNYANNFQIHFKWNVVNNGTLSYVDKVYLYGDITNGVDSSWVWSTYIDDTTW